MSAVRRDQLEAITKDPEVIRKLENLFSDNVKFKSITVTDTITGEDITVSGVSKFGDEAGGDYLEIEEDGTDVRKGDATQWDDLVRSLAGAKLESTAGKVDYDWDENAIVFQSGGSIATQNDRVVFSMESPHAMLPDSMMRLHIHWEQVNTDAVEWTVQHRVQINGATKTTAWTTTVVLASTGAVFPYVSGTLNQISSLVEVDLTGAGLSATVQFRVARTDSTGGDVSATFIDAHIERDMIGSRTEFTK